MTYDDWKARDDAPEPEPEWYCEACHHYGTRSDTCGCPCCTEPVHCQVLTSRCEGYAMPGRSLCRPCDDYAADAADRLKA